VAPIALPAYFGSYLLEERLATGGTADVYVARPIDPSASPARLVIKRLLPTLLHDENARRIFAQEDALYRHVRHENVVSCFGAGEVEGEPFLAMELVAGADLHAVLRAARSRGRSIPVPIALWIGRQILAALDAVHGAIDAEGRALSIVHRDVTPSNVFLSVENGSVKLGDFGIARSASSVRSTPLGLGVRGKFAYLAPEQLAGEPSDFRADLFGAANVTCEIFLGRRLFEGSGQLAVLLAVREAQIDALEAASIAEDLKSVLRMALSRDPKRRFQNASDLSDALAPFSASDAEGRAAVADLVAWARESDRASVLTAPPSMFPTELESKGAPLVLEWSDSALKPMAAGRTAKFTPNPSLVRTTDGRELGPFVYAELVELVATGQLAPDDHVDFMGTGWVRLCEIADLAGYLALREPDTTRIERPGPPDWYGLVAQEIDPESGVVIEPGIAPALAWIAARRATGLLLVEGARRRREIYLRDGTVLHVASNEPAAIGEYLVARGIIERAELIAAIEALPRFNGHITDVLIGLGYIGPQAMTAALEAQVRDQVVNVFTWNEGTLSFYSAGTPGAIERSLSLAVGPIVEAGVASLLDDARATTHLTAWLDHSVIDAAAPEPLVQASWSPRVQRVLELARQPITLRDLLLNLERMASPAEAARAVEAARLVCLIEWA